MVDINLAKDEDAFFNGHEIDGRLLFPATGYMTLAWRQYCKSKNVVPEKTAIVMENVVFHRPTISPKEGSVKLSISFLEGSDQFNISENGTLAMSGKIYFPDDVRAAQLSLNPLSADTDELLNENDVYKELRLRGYDYSGIFHGIHETDFEGVTGTLKWNNNWISYMDTMLQYNILGKDVRELYLPSSLERIIIDPLQHLNIVKENPLVPINMYKHINVMKSGGIEVRGPKSSISQRRSGTHAGPITERYTFIPFHKRDYTENNYEQPVIASVKPAVENCLGILKVSVVDVVADKPVDNLLIDKIRQCIDNEPLLVTDAAICTSQATQPYLKAFGESGIRLFNKDIVKGAVDQNCHLVTGYDIVNNKMGADILKNLKAFIRSDGFILIVERFLGYNKFQANKLFATLHLVTVPVQRNSIKLFILLLPVVDIHQTPKQIVNVTGKSFEWIDELKTALASAEQDDRYVYIVCQGEELFSAVGFINCVKNEVGEESELV